LKVSTKTTFDIECFDCACPGQWLYLLGDEGVVYSEARRRFAGLDAAGVSAYRAFDAGAQVEELRSIGDVFGSSAHSADGLEAIHALAQGIFPDDDSANQPQEICLNTNVSGATYEANAEIEIHGIPISIGCSAGPWEELCRDCFTNCNASDKPAQWHLSAQSTGEAWAIYINDCKVFSMLHEQQLGLGLLHAARSLLSAEGRYDVAFHAAMVASGDCGVMLCAPRECGKSTLTAYLVTQGFEFLADEPAFLHLDTWSVSPLQLPISLKEGSWHALRKHWPQLDVAPVHSRSDGTRVRMVYPPHERCSSRPRRLTQIVFPRYAPSSSEEMESLAPIHTLRLLSEGGVLLAKHFTRADFEALLRFVLRTPAYRIQYASLEEAHRKLYEIGCLGG